VIPTNAVQPLSSSRVAIVGWSGALGFGLIVRLATAGVPIMIGSRFRARTRQAERAREMVPDGDFQRDENDAAAGVFRR
jgi:predicted dinucleotide-binding enzyme